MSIDGCFVAPCQSQNHPVFKTVIHSNLFFAGKHKHINGFETSCAPLSNFPVEIMGSNCIGTFNALFRTPGSGASPNCLHWHWPCWTYVCILPKAWPLLWPADATTVLAVWASKFLLFFLNQNFTNWIFHLMLLVFSFCFGKCCKWLWKSYWQG